MKQRYEELEMEVIAFDTEDVIQKSNEGPLNTEF